MFQFNYLFLPPSVRKKPLFGLAAVLLDVSDVLAEKSHWYYSRNMAFRPVDVHVKLQLLPDGLDVLQTLLVVGSSAADPDLNFVLHQYLSELTERTYNTLESRSNVLQYILALKGVKKLEGSIP